METKTEHYSSQVDTWLVALIACILLGVLILAAFISWKSGDYRAVVFVLVCELVTAGMMALIAYPLQYQLSPDKMLVRSGVMRTEVPVHKITGIQKTRNPFSAPAWSLDRLKIDYDNKGYPAYVIVSPTDQERFIKQLKSFHHSSSAEIDLSK
ncbi:MAG: PH domain-containing protein [Verrucomicrobiota bacterium]